jgi:hypothetical protein
MELHRRAMATKSSKNPIENPFKGVHPILHTFFQMRENNFDHKSLQAPYTSFITRRLNQQLDGSDYVARTDASVHISGRTIFPDVLVKGEEESEFPSSSGGITPDLMILDIPRLTTNVLIGQRTPQSDVIRPVTAIELLSPTNLDRTSRIEEFSHKQSRLLEHGINVLTLHLLQMLPPMQASIPRYPDDAEATPYHMTVTRAQDVHESGHYETYVYRFGIDTPIPTIAIPLLGNDQVVFNFDEPYQETFISERFNKDIDYESISPQVLSKFREADRLYLEQRLVEIRENYGLGKIPAE